MADDKISNLARRGEIDPEVLRQRRDLYVVSLGLSVFYLAEGQVLTSGTMTFIPAKVHEPMVFLWAAWAAFAYFLVRYWMVAPSAWSMYWDEVKWQAGASIWIRKIASMSVCAPMRNSSRRLTPDQVKEADRIEETVRAALLRDRYVPRIEIEKFVPRLQVGSMNRYADRASGRVTAHPDRIDIQSKDQLKFWLSIALGLIRAMYRERSFTDYVLPYLVAALTVGIAVWKTVCG